MVYDCNVHGQKFYKQFLLCKQSKISYNCITQSKSSQVNYNELISELNKNKNKKKYKM